MLAARLAAGVGVGELVILARQDRVDDDAGDGGDSQTGEAQGNGAEGQLDRAGGGEGDAQRQGHDQGNDDDVAAGGEVNLVLDQVANADRGDHAVEDQGDAADGANRHRGNERGELRAEGGDDREDRGEADDGRVIDLGQREDAGVLAVGGVRRSAEEGSQSGREAVAHEGAVQARIFDEVLAHGGGDGADVADVLDHGRQSDRHDRDDGGDQQAAVGLAEEGEDRVLKRDRQTDPARGSHAGEVNLTEDSGQRVDTFATIATSVAAIVLRTKGRTIPSANR